MRQPPAAVAMASLDGYPLLMIAFFICLLLFFVLYRLFPSAEIRGMAPRL